MILKKVAIFLSKGKTKGLCEEGEADVGRMCRDGKFYKRSSEKQIIIKSPGSELTSILVLKAVFITFNLWLVKRSDKRKKKLLSFFGQVSKSKLKTFSLAPNQTFCESVIGRDMSKLL